MGVLRYGSPGVEIDFADRTLAHLQVVIIAKLRHRESLLFSWTDPDGDDHGRNTVWIDPSIPLFFRFFGGRMPTLNPVWLSVLSASANSGTGLVLTLEPLRGGQPPAPNRRPR